MSNLDATVAIGRALAHPARLRAVAMLRSGELCVCQIIEVLQLASSTVSAHLRELKLAGLVRERKEGRWVYVGWSEDPQTVRWLEIALEALLGDPQIEQDDRLVAELRRLPVEDLCRLGYEAARAKQAEVELRRQGTDSTAAAL
ncbi:MAG: winged helix-turn-helix transcriptional regulator [bacterium]|nr:winged helix-turn-helix transcriptional regulator [bacterium]